MEYRVSRAFLFTAPCHFMGAVTFCSTCQVPCCLWELLSRTRLMCPREGVASRLPLGTSDPHTLDKDCRHTLKWNGKKPLFEGQVSIITGVILPQGKATQKAPVHSHPARPASSTVKAKLQEFKHYLWYYNKIHTVGNETDHYTRNW